MFKKALKALSVLLAICLLLGITPLFSFAGPTDPVDMGTLFFPGFGTYVCGLLGKPFPGALGSVTEADLAGILEIDISGMMFGDLCQGHVLETYFTGLKKFNCSGNNLNNPLPLPAGLEEYDCSDNNFTALHPFPAGLKVLNFSGNPVGGNFHPFPANLEELYCSGIGLTALYPLPDSLKVFDCSNNALTGLPGAKLPASLVDFNCSNNLLTGLPDGTPGDSGFPLGLLYCNISGNKLGGLPARTNSAGIRTLPALPDGIIEFDCSDNLIEWVELRASANPDMPLAALDKVDVSNNKASTVTVLGYELYTWDDGNGFIYDRSTQDLTAAIVPVEGISGVPATAEVLVGLNLSSAVVLPNGSGTNEMATNRAIVWSIPLEDDRSTGSVLSGSSLSFTAPGTALVRATITDGKHPTGWDYVEDFAITVEAGPDLSEFFAPDFLAALLQELGKPAGSPLLEIEINTIKTLDMSSYAINGPICNDLLINPDYVNALLYFRQLETLNLKGCGITALPLLPATLKYFDCSDNALEALSQPLPGGLLELDCSNNDISELPGFVPMDPVKTGWPGTLKVLNCSNNSITALPQPLPGGLEVLDCSNNEIAELPGFVPFDPFKTGMPGALKVLNCSGNEITALPQPLPGGLEVLDCSDNLITELPGFVALDLEKTGWPVTLKVLNIADNKIAELSLPLPELEVLICSNNLLTALPDFIEDDAEHTGLPGTLKILECANNLLEELPDPLPPALERFDVSKNALTAIPPLADTLTYLDVSENELTQLEVTGLPLAYLNVSGNMLAKTTVIGFAGTWDEVNYIFGTQVFVPVTAIEYTGAASIAANAALPLSATVAPANAANQTIVWSVKAAGTTAAGASISGGTLTVTAPGAVVVTATIVNGTDTGVNFTADFTVTFTAAPYALTVVNGTGGGNHLQGATVTVNANEPAKKFLTAQRFKEWTSSSTAVVFADKGSATTTFTMPAANTTVTATYESVIRLWGKNTKYASSFWNWLMCILLFGWIWMYFV